ncbi:MAG: sulfatase-like hydrolase/transferase [Planctomycetes bacterium]|nr:sulfatase-like hydrolase/transferase [Planctomycetota bacterium]
MPPLADPRRTAAGRLALDVVDGGVGLACVLIVVRAKTVGWGGAFFEDVWGELPKVLASATYDLLVASTLTATFVIALGFVGGVWPRRVLRGGFWVLAALVLLASLANVTVVEMLGKPFTYQWLYYSDFLNSADARAALGASTTWSGVLATLGALAAVPLVGKLVGASFRFATREWSAQRTAWTLAVLLGLHGWLGHWYLTTEQWPSARTSNPIVVFGESWLQSFRSPVLGELETPYDGADFEAPPVESNAPRGGLENVIVFVLESVGARYLDSFGGQHAVAPNLARLESRSAIFERIYAHMPGTNPSLASLHGAVYPWISFKTVTAEHPDVRLEALPALLDARGRRTAYFSSASLDFQGAREFLDHRGYDVVQGPDTRSRSAQPLRSEWEYLHGTSDADTTDAAIEWLAKNHAEGAMSFAMIWTLQAHYPYYVTGTAREFGTGDELLERYLNAVHESDAALGRLIDWLDAAGLADSTLLVVVADHGEAFGQHGSYGHGSTLFEENLHVPLFLSNPRLFHGERRRELGGLVDVPPTILDCLGIDAPKTWQGRSLFASNRHGRFYACAPWTDFLLGFREGDWKVVLDTLTGDVQVYDLEADPGERVNLAADHADYVEYAKQRLASWIQHQASFYADAFRHRAE